MTAKVFEVPHEANSTEAGFGALGFEPVSDDGARFLLGNAGHCCSLSVFFEFVRKTLVERLALGYNMLTPNREQKT